MILGTQNMITRFEMHQELNIIPLSIRRKHHLRHQAYKGLHGLALGKCDRLEPVSSSRAMQTRSQNTGVLNVQHCRLESVNNFYKSRQHGIHDGSFFSAHYTIVLS